MTPAVCGALALAALGAGFGLAQWLYTRRLLARPERPTALFCISDVLALGAVQAARELGLRVPEDLSVVGFDDVEYAVMGHPRLTTVRQPCYELGRTAGELLLT